MKLHIGGEDAKEGWTIINAQQKEHVDIVGNITDLSEFKDESIDAIYASHVLEHVSQNDITKTIAGIYRVLKKGGTFYCSVPNMEVLSKMLIHKDLDINQKWHVMRMMFGGQIDDYDFHFIGWTLEFLNNFLGNAGFKSFERVESFNLFDDTSDYKAYGVSISLNLIVKK